MSYAEKLKGRTIFALFCKDCDASYGIFPKLFGKERICEHCKKEMKGIMEITIENVE